MIVIIFVHKLKLLCQYKGIRKPINVKSKILYKVVVDEKHSRIVLISINIQ